SFLFLSPAPRTESDSDFFTKLEYLILNHVFRPNAHPSKVSDTGISLNCSRLASRLLLFYLTRFPCGGAARGKTMATTSRIELLGGCHCGNIRVWLRLAQRPSEILLRACACSFCRMHGTRTVADPGGHFEVEADDWSLVERYRFGL